MENSKKKLNWQGGCLTLFGAILILGFCTENKKEPLTGKEKRDSIEFALYVRSEFYIKNNLKDPDSYKESKVGPLIEYVDDKTQQKTYMNWIEYRAKNSFNAIVPGFCRFTYDTTGTMLTVETEND